MGEFVLARPRDEWGVRRVYGYPGDGLSGVIGAFQHLGGNPVSPGRPGELLGLKSLRVDSPDAVRPAWEEALAHDGPVLYEAVTDPNIPPLPPQIRFETARNMTRAFLRGDPAARDIVRHTIRARRADLGSR